MTDEEIMEQINEYSFNTRIDEGYFLMIVKLYLENEDEISVEQIIDNYVGKYDNPENFVSHFLDGYEIENKLMNITFKLNNNIYYLDEYCLDLEYIWRSIFKTYYVGLYGDDTYFYVYKKG